MNRKKKDGGRFDRWKGLNREEPSSRSGAMGKDLVNMQRTRSKIFIIHLCAITKV